MGSVGVSIGSQGVVESNNASGVQLAESTSNAGFMPFPVASAADVDTVSTATKVFAAGEAGIHVLSSSTGAISGTLPLASLAAGGLYTFRCGSAHAHFLSASLETVGTKAICMRSGSAQATVWNGSKATLEAVVGTSVTLFCDGKSFCIMTASGSVVLSQ